VRDEIKAKRFELKTRWGERPERRRFFQRRPAELEGAFTLYATFTFLGVLGLWTRDQGF